ncbi:hypothetical protein FACS189499_00820 [Clostridia bacterium]|nr:hypothetical protein FACS189499_00820 [Clostridia bacterium]
MRKLTYKKITIALIALILLLFPVMTFVFMPDDYRAANSFSENENRFRQKFPELSLSTVTDKSFMKGFEKYVSDRFFAREELIALKNESDKLSGKTEINDVYIADGRMVESFPEYDAEKFEKNVNAVENFAKRHASVPVYFTLIPNAAEIYKDTLPPFSPSASQVEFIGNAYAAVPSATGVDVYPELKSAAEAGNYIYYRTDHHWTTFGAYMAYNILSGIMGFTMPPSFDVETAAEDFRGTLYSKTLDRSVSPDTIEYWHIPESDGGDPPTTLEILKYVEYGSYDSMYFREYLARKDKYSSFLGGNDPVVKIKSELPDSENGGKLLVIKDSYSHCLAPFLAKSFGEVTLLDMRYINIDYRELVNVEDYDAVLFFYNVITFAEDTDIRKLNYAELTSEEKNTTERG